MAGTTREQLNKLQSQLDAWRVDTLREMRTQGDAFTTRVARTFAKFGKELNRVTGYEEIELLKRRVVEQELRIGEAREAARAAKEAYSTAVLQRADSQREVTDLLQRKSSWTDGDVMRYTALIREDHAREQAEARAKVAAGAADDAVERAFSDLLRVTLGRYHEEQAWSDKIRSASTYGTLAALALNLCVFVAATLVVEPWKRRRLAQTFERKVEELATKTDGMLEGHAREMQERLDRQEALLQAAMAVTTTVAAVAPVEAEAGEVEDRGKEAEAEGGAVEGILRRRPLDEKQLLLVASASAGLLGWLARSWLG
ncbi:Mdm33 family-domain-containing protein [Epithele typhae]|uniref:Mdm33 family-domain-containing protein n=1 Tax=Epithele typhae TaxID=378194 RepID=UPI0020079CF0|nr:Mdm33 family-domain-containing protein [Epithele typhae]KAH9933138.1 Mdm33 family-domain-containing protein [Epithele typhae]